MYVKFRILLDIYSFLKIFYRTLVYYLKQQKIVFHLHGIYVSSIMEFS